jgi:hypothetical protein
LYKIYFSFKSLRLRYILITCLVFILACSLEEPKLPEWYVEWKIPIQETNFMIEEVISDTNVVLDSMLINQYYSYFLCLVGDVTYTREPDTMRLGEKERDYIEKDVVSATAVSNVINELPTEAQISIHVGADSSQLFSDTIVDSNYKFILKNITVPAANVGADGFVTESKEVNITQEVTKQQLHVLSQDTLFYMGTKMVIKLPADSVKFNFSDEIRSRGLLQLKFRMNSQ